MITWILHCLIPGIVYGVVFFAVSLYVHDRRTVRRSIRIHCVAGLMSIIPVAGIATLFYYFADSSGWLALPVYFVLRMIIAPKR